MASNSFQPLTGSQPPKGLKIVMIGRTGAGKSATGNTILMRKVFRSLMSSTAVTQMCQVEGGQLDGQILAVVDTTGLFGGSSSESPGVKSPDEVMKEIQRCLSHDPPGPVVFLVVIQTGKFTPDEQQMVKIIQSAFGKETAHYTMALFTRGDDLKTERRSVEDLIGADPVVRDFIRECYGGYHVLDNRDSDPSQVVELLQKINNMVQRNGERGSTNERWRVLQEEAQGRGGRGGAAGCNTFIEGALVGGAFVGGFSALILAVMLIFKK